MPRFGAATTDSEKRSHETAGEGRRSGLLKLAVGLAAVGAGVVAAWYFGVFEVFNAADLDRLDAWFGSLGWWAPVVFVLLWVVATVFFLPGVVLTVAGGLVFGAFWGAFWTTIGANAGAAAAFLIGRYAARGMVERMIENNPRLRKIDDGVRRHGWRMLMITRLVPVFPFNVQNYLYGLTDISLKTYVSVTLPCMVPATLAYSFAAGSVRTGDLARTLQYLGIAAVFFVLLSLIPGWVRSWASSGDLDI